MKRSRQLAMEQLGWAMQRHQRSVQAYDDVVGGLLGLGPAEMRCLDWLADGAKTAGQIGRAAGLRPAATTALIDRLVTKGFALRRPSPDDGRQVMVVMTDDGQRRTGAMYGPLVSGAREVLRDYTIDDLDRLRSLMEDLTALTDDQRAGLENRQA